MQPINVLMLESKKVSDKLDQLILKTPTGETREILTEANILINTLSDAVHKLYTQREEVINAGKTIVLYVNSNPEDI